MDGSISLVVPGTTDGVTSVTMADVLDLRTDRPLVEVRVSGQMVVDTAMTEI